MVRILNDSEGPIILILAALRGSVSDDCPYVELSGPTARPCGAPRLKMFTYLGLLTRHRNTFAKHAINVERSLV
jgi:hypothetical protein